MGLAIRRDPHNPHYTNSFWPSSRTPPSPAVWGGKWHFFPQFCPFSLVSIFPTQLGRKLPGNHCPTAPCSLPTTKGPCTPSLTAFFWPVPKPRGKSENLAASMQESVRATSAGISWVLPCFCTRFWLESPPSKAGPRCYLPTASKRSSTFYIWFSIT